MSNPEVPGGPVAEHAEHKSEKGGAHGGGRKGLHRPTSHEEPHEGAPEWIISFADNVTLMMGFFVILFSLTAAMKMGAAGGGSGGEPSPEYLDTAIGIRAGFNNPVDINSLAPEDRLLVRRLRQLRGDADARDPGQTGRDHEVQSLRPTSFHARSGLVRFESGSAELTDAARQAIRETAELVRGLRLIVNVTGHASAAEAFGLPDQGLRISFDRAAKVADALCAEGVQRKCLRVIACGSADPALPGAKSLRDHAHNQRVEVVLTDEILADEPAPDAD